jgi:hypothetical protein
MKSHAKNLKKFVPCTLASATWFPEPYFVRVLQLQRKYVQRRSLFSRPNLYFIPSELRIYFFFPSVLLLLHFLTETNVRNLRFKNNSTRFTFWVVEVLELPLKCIYKLSILTFEGNTESIKLLTLFVWK